MIETIENNNGKIKSKIMLIVVKVIMIINVNNVTMNDILF